MNPLDGVSVTAERTLRIIDQIASSERDAQAAADGLIMNLCTRMEVYSDGLIDALIEDSPILTFPLGRMLLSDVSGSYRFSWTERLRWLSLGFGIAISGTTPIQNMLTLTELRNAVTHGGGQLTWVQKKSLPKQLDLERKLHRVLAVNIEGSFLQYGQATVDRATAVATAYVLAVDSATRQVHPGLHV